MHQYATVADPCCHQVRRTVAKNSLKGFPSPSVLLLVARNDLTVLCEIIFIISPLKARENKVRIFNNEKT